jgi:hypothetical protein
MPGLVPTLPSARSMVRRSRRPAAGTQPPEARRDQRAVGALQDRRRAQAGRRYKQGEGTKSTGLPCQIALKSEADSQHRAAGCLTPTPKATPSLQRFTGAP